MTILEKYDELCRIENDKNIDIRLHLPTLKEYADKCNVVIEMGVRHCISTFAFLASKANYVIGYDITQQPEVKKTIQMCWKENRSWEFYEANVLEVDIDECDMLFIDTFHTATQLNAELNRHAGKVKKYIAMHDTTTYWDKGEDGYEHAAPGMNCGRGLKEAVLPFLDVNKEWLICHHSKECNGLLIIERK